MSYDADIAPPITEVNLELDTNTPAITGDIAVEYLSEKGFDDKSDNPLKDERVWMFANQQIDSKISDKLAAEAKLQARADEIKTIIVSKDYNNRDDAGRIATERANIQLEISYLQNDRKKLENIKVGAAHRRMNGLPTVSEQSRQMGRQLFELANTPGIDLKSSVDQQLDNLAKQPDAEVPSNLIPDAINKLNKLVDSGTAYILDISTLEEKIDAIRNGERSLSEIQDKTKLYKENLKALAGIYLNFGFLQEILSMEETLKEYEKPEYLSLRATSYIRTLNTMIRDKQPFVDKAVGDINYLNEKNIQLTAQIAELKEAKPSSILRFFDKNKITQEDINKKISDRQKDLETNQQDLKAAQEEFDSWNEYINEQKDLIAHYNQFIQQVSSGLPTPN